MKWPKRIKVGGAFIKLIIGERRMVVPNTSQYYMGEFRENLKEIEVSQGEDEIDIFLHELVHAIQYAMGDYSSPSRDEDKGNEDQIAQAIRAFMLDNADFIRDLLDEIEKG